MKRSTLYLIVVIAIFSLVLIVTRNNNRAGPSRVKKLSALQLEKIQLKKLDIKTSNELIALYKGSAKKDQSGNQNNDAANDVSAEAWTIGDKRYKSDDTKVIKLVNAFASNMTLELVSDITLDKSQYNLDDENKIEVTLYGVNSKTDDKNLKTNQEGFQLLRRLYIGKNATTYNHVYVSLEGDDNIYQVAAALRSTFDITSDSLRDKLILTFDSHEIDTLEIQNTSGITYILSQEADKKINENDNANNDATQKLSWYDKKGNRYKDASIDAMVNALTSLKCKEFLPETKEEIALEEKVERVLTIKTKGGTKHILYILSNKTDDNHTRAYSSGSRFGFVLENNTSESLLKSIRELRE